MPIPLYFTSHTHDGFRKRVWFAPSAHTHETTQTVRNPLTQGSCCSTPSRPREAQRLSRDTPPLLAVCRTSCVRASAAVARASLGRTSSPLARGRSLAHGGKALTSPSPSPVHPKTEAQIAAHQSCLCLSSIYRNNPAPRSVCRIAGRSTDRCRGYGTRGETAVRVRVEIIAQQTRVAANYKGSLPLAP